MTAEVRATADDASRVRQMTDELIVGRVRIGLWIMLGSAIAFAVMSAVLRRGALPMLHVAQASMTVIFTALLLVLRSPRVVPWVRWVGLAAVAAGVGFGVFMGTLIADPVAIVLLQMTMMMGAATLVPWGVRPQILCVLLSATSLMFVFSEGLGGFEPFATSTTVSICVVLLATVYLSHILARHQLRAATRDLDLERSQEMLRGLSARLVSLQEEERAHIARELHDELGQLLVALKLELNRATAGDDAVHAELRAQIGRAMMVLDETIHTVRNLSRELRPTVLDDLGLAAALDSQVREFRERTGIDCELTLDGDELEIEGERAVAVFRIIQEAMTNVAQHAEASTVAIRIDREAERLVLTVEDDGRGISETERDDPHSIGLIGMRERARNWGGEVEISGTPGKGTRIRVRIPEPA